MSETAEPFDALLPMSIPVLRTSRYINNPREALKEFNFARTDTKWGAKVSCGHILPH